MTDMLKTEYPLKLYFAEGIITSYSLNGKWTGPIYKDIARIEVSTDHKWVMILSFRIDGSGQTV